MIKPFLKPCPFCGAPAAAEITYHFQPQLLADGSVYQARSVHCSQAKGHCMGQGPICGSEEGAIEAWNRRAH